MSTVRGSEHEVLNVGETRRPAGDDGALGENNPPQPARVFNSDSERDWCELVRDVAAIANSGGGRIVLKRSTGQTPIAANDLLQRLRHYTDSSFSVLEVHSADSGNGATETISIGRAPFPIVFTKSATYADPAESQTRIEIFAAGSLYFRNGERSEPATSRSLQTFVAKLMRRIRRRWLRGIRRVMSQPIDTLVGAEQKPAKRGATGQANLQPVRIVTDPDAPVLQPQDVDRLYPLRQKDLVAELNRRLGKRAVNSYDIQAVRRQHKLDERPEFVFHLPGAGRRYSPAVMQWIIEQYDRDPEFFRKARVADSEVLKLRRQKPR